MIIAKLPTDGLRLLEGGLKPAASTSATRRHPGTKFKMVTRTCAVTPEDAAIYREIVKRGYELTGRMVPADPKNDFIELIAKKGL